MTRLGSVIAVLLSAAFFSPEAQAQAVNVRAKLNALKEAEPSAYEVQERALKHFKVNPERIAWLRNTASWKALVPIFEVSGGGTAARLDESTILAEFSTDPERPWITRGASGGAGEVRSRLTWDLPRLMFNAEELDVTGLTVVQRDVVEQTTRIYYLRRRLQLQLLVSSSDDEAAQLEKELRVEELTSLLSGMTGGWFEEELKRKGG